MASISFVNLSVSKKLAVGFGLILMLTLVVMFSGLRSNDKMVSSGDNISRVNRMEVLLLQSQVSVERFIAAGSPGEARQLDLHISSMDSQLKENILFLNAPSEQKSLLEIQASLNEYRNSLHKLLQAQNRRDASRAKMVSFGNAALTAIDELHAIGFKKIVDGNYHISLPQRVQLLSHLDRSLRNVRFLVRGFVHEKTEASEKAAADAIKDFTVSLDQSVALTPEIERASLLHIKEILKQYQEGYDSFSRALIESKAAAQELSDYGDSMRSATAQLSQEQIAYRATVVASAKQSLIGTTLISIVFAFLAAWLITRQIVQPLRQMLDISSLIAKGDLRSNFISERKDELGQLERSISEMAQNLRQLIGFIGDGVIKIAGAAEQLSAATEQTNVGVSRQRRETDQVATAMREMVHTVQDVARNAEDASVAAIQADEVVKGGDQKLNQAVRELDRLTGEISLCAESVASLQGECQQIGGVLSIIKSLAEQTNLLALNAAIEAARAGQAGAGFAVVADEVRALAQRTQQAATEIDNLVSSLQRGANTASDLMARSCGMAALTLDLGREASTSLTSISQSVSVMQTMNLQIAAAAEEQSAAAEQISGSITEVRSISEKTAKASDDTATSSTSLAVLGEELQQYVMRFKI